MLGAVQGPRDPHAAQAGRRPDARGQALFLSFLFVSLVFTVPLVFV